MATQTPVLSAWHVYLVLSTVCLAFLLMRIGKLASAIHARESGLSHIPYASPLGDRALGLKQRIKRLIIGDLSLLGRPVDAASAQELLLDSTRSCTADGTAAAVFVYRDVLSTPRVVLFDPLAVQHVLSVRSFDAFVKPPLILRILTRTLGRGLLVVDGPTHRRQRKQLGPAFAQGALRGMVPAIFEQAGRLAGIIDDGISGRIKMGIRELQKVGHKEEVVIDFGLWASKLALDIIGQVGFSRDLGALSELCSDKEQAPDPLRAAFDLLNKILLKPKPRDMVLLALAQVPGFAWVRSLPTERNVNLRNVFETFSSTAKGFLDERRALLSGGERQAKDLLDHCVWANMDPKLKEGDRMSDEEIIAQVNTFMTGAVGTTSSGMSWLFHYLSLPENIQYQTRLRDEVQGAFGDREAVALDELNGLIFLDHVVKESLRLTSPTAEVVREVADDMAVLPLSRPYPCRAGSKTRTFDKIVVRRGQRLMIPVHLMNTGEEIWGPDAKNFNPDRWSTITAGSPASQLLLSFSVGPRSCIGNRLALVQLKALVCTLIRRYRFETVATPDGEIQVGPAGTGFLRPVASSDIVEGVNGTFPVRFSRL